MFVCLLLGKFVCSVSACTFSMVAGMYIAVLCSCALCSLARFVHFVRFVAAGRRSLCWESSVGGLVSFHSCGEEDPRRRLWSVSGLVCFHCFPRSPVP